VTAVLERPLQAPVPFERLLRAEVRKASDTRSGRWLLVGTVALSVVVGSLGVILPTKIDQSLTDYAGLASTGFGFLLPIVAILLVTTEWTQRTVMTTFALEPRRARVVLAKVLTAVALGVLGFVLTLGYAAAALAVSGALGRETSWSDFDAGRTAGLLASMVLGTLGAIALGLLLHNTATAIVTLYALPTLTGILGSFAQDVTQYVDIARASEWVTDGAFGAHGWPILTNHLLWVLVPLALGVRRTLRREVS
jgi:hypothetical protein